MHKLLSVTKEQFELPIWLTNYGSYNQMPTPFYECDESSFWKEFFMYSPSFIDHRQVFDLISGRKAMQTVKIYWFHDKAFAVQQVYQDGHYSPRFYQIGCEHSFHELQAPQHTRHEKCAKCGFEQVFDTSG